MRLQSIKPKIAKTIFSIMLLHLMVITSAISETENRITILYDSIGEHAFMQSDWGFAAYIEFADKRILFDTGNNTEILKNNSKTAKVDLSTIDFVIISHWHDDHTAGLGYLREINPDIPIYVPKNYSSNSNDQNKLELTQLTEINEIYQDIFIISSLRNKAGLSKLQELTLALQTSQGLILVAGCSHPGIQQIVNAATKINPTILNIFGGFHLLRTPADKISTIASALRNDYEVKKVSPGHCTGEAANREFLKIFKDDFVHAGIGTVINLPQ